MKHFLPPNFHLKLPIILTVLSVAVFFSNAVVADGYKYQDSWGKAGYTLEAQSASVVTLNYSIENFNISDMNVNGESMMNIELPGNILFNDEGAPNLPGSGRFLAIPEGASAKVTITSSRKETLSNVMLAPAPRIPWETEKGPLEYYKDQEIYNKDEFYPAQPVQLSEVTQIRGVDAVMLGITPFQYNPVTRELVVYRDIKVEVSFEGGNGQFGEDRLRSRWWDPIMADMFLNHESLPKIDYNKSYAATEETGCEYLIVVPTDAEFAQWADSIKEFRTMQGIMTDVMTVEECGGNNVSDLEDFFDNAYEDWDIAPSAVLLIGDYGTDASNRITSPIWDGYCVSDNIWADVSGNDMPDIIFARMTAQNEDQLEVMVTKFLDYERNPPTSEDFYANPITALGFQTERWFQICSESVAGFWENEHDKSTVRINKTYSGNPSTDPWSTATNTTTVLNLFGPDGLGYIPETPADVNCTWNGTAQDVVNAINNGAFMLQHRDHGMETGWGEPYFTNSNISSLTNTDLTFVWSINCLTGKYNYSSEVFAEKFHRHTYNGENSGALAVNAASEVSYSFVNDTYVWGAYDNMWPDFLPDYGSTPEERGLLPAFAMAAGKYFLEASSWPYNTSNKEVTYNLFHHHGDAFNVVYSEVPEDLDVTHDPILYAGVTSFDVNVNDGAFIALTVNGEIIATAEGTGAPVSIEIPGQVPPDIMIVTITAQNYYRYSAAVEVIPPTGPYVVKESFTINDESGNNNGMMDYAESNMLSLTVENVGVEQADGVVVTLTTEDEYISITDGEETYGDIPAGGLASIDDGFAYDVAQDIPDGHNVTFEVSATNGVDVWTSYIGIEGHAPVLEFVDFEISDPNGNNNGKIDPGETVEISIDIENTGSSDAFTIVGMLSAIDPYLTIDSDDVEFGDLAFGSTASAVFSATADENTPAGHTVDIQFDMEADLGIAGAGSFSVVIGQIPILIIDLDGNGNSASGMEDAIAETELAYEKLTSFPPDLNLYSSVFVCLGIYSSNHVLTSTEGQKLADYLDAGGSLYMEGGDTWYYDNSTPVHDMFGINAVSDGSGDMSTVEGQAGTFTEGMSFSYSGDNNWMDHIEAISPAELIFENTNPSYGTAVAFDEGSYRTIGSSHEFGGLDDGSSPSTKEELMNEYLQFLGFTMSLQASFGSSSTEICENETVEFFDQSVGDVISWSWTFEGASPSTSTFQNPTVAYFESGVYDVTLEVFDGTETSTMTLEDYITVMDAPMQAEMPEGDVEICTNTIVSTEYTTAGAEYADEYVWEISPAEAGTIDGDGMEATVSWTTDWEGTAYVKVKGMNDCGEGTFSEELEVLCWVCTGIADLTKQRGVAIYPNPSNGSFTVEFNDNFGQTEVQVVNLLNKVVYKNTTETTQGTSLKIDLSEHAEGIYFVKMKNSNAELVRKVIVR